MTPQIVPGKTQPGPGVPRSMMLIVSLLAVLAILLPYTVWRGTWFGRALSDHEIAAHLTSSETKPRDVQHALEQLSRRLNRTSIDLFVPMVVSLADHPEPSVRQTAAWFMGEEGKNELFRSSLASLLDDELELVRQNAALGLARFRDPACRRVLLGMLEPSAVRASLPGEVIEVRETDRDFVPSGGVLALVQPTSGPQEEIVAPIEGSLRDFDLQVGSQLRLGEEICRIAPESAQIFSALRALFLVGTEEDLDAIEEWAGPVHQLGDQVRAQASATLRAIRGREAGAGKS